MIYVMYRLPDHHDNPPNPRLTASPARACSAPSTALGGCEGSVQSTIMILLWFVPLPPRFPADHGCFSGVAEGIVGRKLRLEQPASIKPMWSLHQRANGVVRPFTARSCVPPGCCLRGTAATAVSCFLWRCGDMVWKLQTRGAAVLPQRDTCAPAYHTSSSSR